jgi:hypothetical protein
MEIIYSAQPNGFAKGRVYLNPRFFDGTLQPGATSVIVVGDWPKVVASYDEAGIPVRQIAPGEKLPAPNHDGDDNVSEEVNSSNPRSVVRGRGKNVGKIEPPLKPGGDNVEIPEGFADLPYRDLTSLIAKIDPTADVSSKKDAVAWLAAIKEGKEPASTDDE